MKQVRTTSCSLLLWLKRRKWTLLIFWYACGAMVAMIWGVNSPLGMSDSTSRVDISSYKLMKNQIGAFGYTRCDPAKNYRPLSAVYFDELNTTNGQIGFFKTALHKVVKIRDFELKFYHYTSPEVTASAIPDVCLIHEDITTDVRALFSKITHKLTNPMDGWRVNVDLGNISELRVNNFDYKVFYDGDLFFAIQSKRATASYKHSGIVLRGHVTIQTGDGGTLESNYVEWDVKKQHFNVNGVYVLNRDGIKTMGKDICVDAQLKSVKVQRAKFKQKEIQKCFVKL